MPTDINATIGGNTLDPLFDAHENDFNRFANGNYYKPDKVIAAYKADDKVELSESMGEPVEKNIKKKFRAKKEMSKASQQLLNNLKSA